MMRSRMAAAPPFAGYASPYRAPRLGAPPTPRHPLILGPSSRPFAQAGMGSAMGEEAPRGSTTTKMCLCQAKRMGGTCRCGSLGQGCATATKGGANGGVATGSGGGASPAVLALGGAGILAVGLLVAGVI